MKQRALSIVFVVVALLFSAWGNVIAAAFCPRFAQNRDCCLKHPAQQPKPVKHESSCHHEMAGMEMGEMQMDTEAEYERDFTAQDLQVELPSAPSTEEVALDLPIEACAHCLSHSQPTSRTISVPAIDPSRRLVENNSLPANIAIGLTASFADLIAPSEHGPPRPSSPRHLVINVFRI